MGNMFYFSVLASHRIFIHLFFLFSASKARFPRDVAAATILSTSLLGPWRCWKAEYFSLTWAWFWCANVSFPVSAPWYHLLKLFHVSPLQRKINYLPVVLLNAFGTDWNKKPSHPTKVADLIAVLVDSSFKIRWKNWTQKNWGCYSSRLKVCFLLHSGNFDKNFAPEVESYQHCWSSVFPLDKNTRDSSFTLCLLRRSKGLQHVSA